MKLRASVLRLLTVVGIASVVAILPSMQARASEPGEVAFSTLEMSPIGGKLYREARVPVEWRVQAEISAPFPEVPKVRPIKTITAAFPSEMAFAPAPDLSICPDRILSPSASSLGVPAAEMIRKCPLALIGNGRAKLYLAANNSASGPQLENTELVIFYGGRSASGTARLKVYGFDPEVNAGVYMEGTWTDNVLEVSIPKLPFGTSTGFFELAIPGRNNGFPSRVGRDPGFVRANCPNGFWAGTSEFLLGDRLDSGEPSGEEALVRAPDFRSDCVGLDGKAALRLTTPGGSKPVGRRASLSVLVTNPGTATARDIRLRVSGKGVRQSTPLPTVSSLAPGASRRVKARVSFVRTGPIKIEISALGSGLKPVTLVRSLQVR
jgi:hypothetical protein